MRSSVVFLAGIALVIYGKQVGDSDAQYGGCMLFVIGLVAMFIGWAQQFDKKV